MKEDRVTSKMHRLLIILIFIIFYATLAPQVQAQTSTPSDYVVKAAFLYNFAKFVVWPDNNSSENDDFFEIGVLGDNPFDELLKKSAAGKSIKGKSVRIREVQTLDSIGTCQVLYISTSEKTRYKEILARIADRPILTVGDSREFTKSGGIIAFFVKDNKVRFRINVSAAAKVGLDISSKLLKLADLKPLN
jgi:YfiR/HmsC-like